MSRAFVREEDPLRPEPPPEFKLSSHPNLVTPRGLERIEQAIDDLNAMIAQSPIGEIKDRLLRDLRYWTARKETARVVEPEADSDEVRFGSRVTFRRGDGPSETIEIVGEDESDPKLGRIGWVAPLASSMMGARVGEVVMLDNRRPAVPITILAVDPI
jgi:transcription elongation factor GreB